LAITAGNSRVVAFDNISSLPGWFSDALCRLATGGGFGTRQLWTDDEEMLFDAQRPIILNGIAAVGARPDLLERSLLIELPTIPDEQRRTEADLFAEFDSALPGIMGGLLDAVAGALRDLPGVTLARLPRMADFAAWATAAESALGWERGTFLAAYADARQQAVDAALDASPIADPIRRLLDAGEWQGTASELLERLAALAVAGATKAEDWPRRANTLSAQLRRLAPDFRRAGISVRWERQARNRTRYIHLGKSPDSSCASSASGNPPNSSSAGSSATPSDSSEDSQLTDDSDDAYDGSPRTSSVPGRDYPAQWDHPIDIAPATPTLKGEAWLKSLDEQNGPYRGERR
jgi:hypothetical protein